MRRIQTSSSAERGQSFVELALSLILLIMLLVAILDFGRAFFIFTAVRDAAQEGASYAATNPTDSLAIEDRIRYSSNRPVNLQDTSHVIIDVAYNGDPPVCAGALATVTVTYQNFQISTPFLGAILGTQTLNIRGVAKDIVLRPTCP